jgi:Sulfatase
VLVLLDDVGFGQFSVFGGGVASPNMERLASQGLRYNRFHTTALCSPTRAALLTGRNHHMTGNGSITEAATGYVPDHVIYRSSTKGGAPTLNSARIAILLGLSGPNSSDIETDYFFAGSCFSASCGVTWSSSF